LAVILIHTTTRTLEASAFDLQSYSWTLFLNQISRFAVPLFFIISGLVLELSAKEESYRTFFKRRFIKIFVPFVIWSLFYYYLVYNQNHDSLLKVFLTGNASYQLYFIPTLCIYYLLFPLLHKKYKIISNKFFLAFLGLSQIALQSYDYYIKDLDFSDPIRIVLMSYLFFVIGIIAARNIEKINSFVKKQKIMLTIFSIASGIFVFWEGRSRFLSTGNYLSYYSQWRPSVLIYTILVGLFFYYIFEYLSKKTSVISKFSTHSFFVFFVHVAVLELMWTYLGNKVFVLLNGSLFGKLIFDPIFFTIVAFASFLIARFIHKIPKSGRLLG